MKLIEAFLKNPYLVVVAVLALMVVGATSLTKIPADLLPTFNTPAVQIITFYRGMPPEVMERDITSRLERWTGQSMGIEHQEAKSMLGVSIVKDFFHEDISFDTAMSQVTSYAMSDLFYLPPGTIPPMVMPFDPTASVPLALVAVSSDTLNEKELYDVAYFELRNRLQSIRGVIAPAVYGGVLRRILAYVDRYALEARGLSPMDIVTALRTQNILIPTGNAKFGDLDYQIISNAMVPEVELLNDIPIRTVGNTVVFMRDVADVQDSNEIQSNIVRINGRRQVYIPVYRQPGANTIAIVDSIKSQLEQILQRLREMDPKNHDLVLSVVMDQSTYVRSSISALVKEAGLGAILAGLVVLIFLRSFRATLIAVITLPISFLASIIGLHATGGTLNSMTLGGLALAVGIILDQSIVALENIMRHRELGKSRSQAALHGASEVALPIFVSVLTFGVVFFPVVFLTGVAKFLFAPLALAVVFAIGASFFVALFVVPTACDWILPEVGTHIATARSQRSSSLVDRLFDRTLPVLLRARFLVIIAAGVVLAGAGMLMANSGRELFPPVDSGQFTIYVRLPSGTRIERTEDLLSDLEQTLMDEIGRPDSTYPNEEQYPDSNLRILISNAGVLNDWPAAYTPNDGPMDAFVLVQLKNKKGMPTTFEYVARLRGQLNQEFPGVDFAFDTGGMMTAALNMGLPSPIDIQIQGSSLDTLDELAQSVRQIAAAVPGTADARIAQRLDYPQIDIKVDRVKAAQLGVTQEDVIKNVVTALNSSIGFNPAFWIDPKNGNHYFIGAQYQEEDIESLETLLDIPITGSNTVRPVSLRNLVTLGRKTGPAAVKHVNITRTVDVYVNVQSGYDVGRVAEVVEAELLDAGSLGLTARQTPRGLVYDVTGVEYEGKGYSISMRGEVQTMRESLRQFLGGFVIAIILIYLVIVATLRSFLLPLAILSAVPLGLIGVAVSLTLTGTALSIPAAMGILMMSGIVVEFSVILLAFAEQLVADGMAPRAAIIEAVKIRFRPILMTSLAAWLAMLPMAIGGQGAEANTPLARAVIGGIISAAFLTMFVVPCFYIVLKGKTASPSTKPIGA